MTKQRRLNPFFTTCPNLLKTEMFETASLLEYAMILLVGFVAGATGAFVGGGGGLLSVSFLILLGIPPHIAVATNRFAAIGASGTAFLRFFKSGKIVWPLVPVFILLGVLGGIIGAEILVKTNESVLQTFTGLALICLAPLVFAKKDFGVSENHTPFWSKRFFLGCFLYFLLMIFGGFFGPGVGILFILLVVRLFGLTFIQAIATDNLPWAIMSISTLVVLALEGLVDWASGAFLFAGMAAGGWFGADRALHYGDKIVKQTFIIVCAVLGVAVLLK